MNPQESCLAPAAYYLHGITGTVCRRLGGFSNGLCSLDAELVVVLKSATMTT